jgi:hypothetical protein
MRNVIDKSCRENKNTHFMFNNFFSENRTVCEIMSRHLVETEGPQMTSQHGAYALRVGLARLYALMRMHTPTPTRSGNHVRARTHAQACTHKPLRNTCFPIATMVSLTRLNVTLHVHCLSCLMLNPVVHKVTAVLLKGLALATLPNEKRLAYRPTYHEQVFCATPK